MFIKLKKIFEYLTNNEEKSRHEELFDIFFLVINTIALVLGVAILVYIRDYQWIPFLVIEYTWAWDNMRHNRL